jgi:hypothetical protein
MTGPVDRPVSPPPSSFGGFKPKSKPTWVFFRRFSLLYRRFRYWAAVRRIQGGLGDINGIFLRIHRSPLDEKPQLCLCESDPAQYNRRLSGRCPRKKSGRACKHKQEGQVQRAGRSTGR